MTGDQHEPQWEKACPYCGAEPGTPCSGSMGETWGGIHGNKYVHPERKGFRIPPKHPPVLRPKDTLMVGGTSPLQHELDSFCTTEEMKRGWVSKERANEICDEWRIWKHGRTNGR
jgi:hypothetical protein